MPKIAQRFFLTLSILFALTSCNMMNIGMGSSIDLEAPVISIKSPQANSKVATRVTLTGTCSDNVAVTSVIITDESGTKYGTATINGDVWFCQLYLPEGQITLRCTANDAFGNSSVTSSKVITLLVDETAPESASWTVDRGNQNPKSLMAKDDLQRIDMNLPANKFYPQNEQVIISGRFFDAMGISRIRLTLKDEGGTVIYENSVSSEEADPDFIGTANSIYSPKFTVNASDFPAGYDIGEHYINVWYYSIDLHGNERDADAGWFLWSPERDKPGIYQSQTSSDNELTASVDTRLPLDFYDDDGIDEIYYLLTDTNPYTVEGLLGTQKDTFKNAAIVQNCYRTGINNYDVSIDDAKLTTPSSACNRYLIALAKDKKDNWSAKIIHVIVVDDSKPILFIEAPEEYSIPSFEGDGKSFKLSGYSLDTKGCKSLKLAYVPSSVTGSTAFKEQEADKALAGNPGANPGIVVKNLTGADFDTNYSAAPVWNGMKKQTFAYSINLFDTAVIPAADRKETKFFRFLLTDSDDNTYYKTLQLAGDTDVPVVNFYESVTAGSPNTEKEFKNMTVLDYNESDLVLYIKAEKENGLAMSKTADTLYISYGSDKYTYDSDEFKAENIGDTEYLKFCLTKAQLNVIAETKKDKSPQFTIHCEDVLGNVREDFRTVYLSPLPSLRSITTNKSTGTYKELTSIEFYANFSSQVKAIKNSSGQKPVLLLYYSEADRTAKQNAVEVPLTSETDTALNMLKFTWNVPSEKTSTKLVCGGIYLPAGVKIEATGDGLDSAAVKDAHLDTLDDDNTLNGKIISIDSVKPYITAIRVYKDGDAAQGANDTYVKEKDVIIAKVTCSENVLVTGDPTLKLKIGTSPVTATFLNSSDSDMFFTYTVPAQINGLVTGNLAEAIAAADFGGISDTAGNILKSAASKNYSSKIHVLTTAPQYPELYVKSSKDDADISEQIDFTTLEVRYGYAQQFKLVANTEGNTLQYSLDGGVWQTYTVPFSVTDSSEYTIAVREIDAAGNISDTSPVISVKVSAAFPKIQTFVISKSDGKYKKGEKVSFKLFFEDAIRVTSRDSYLTLTNCENSEQSAKAYVKLTAANSTYAEFEYEVGEVEFNGIQVTAAHFADTFTDSFGNETSTYSNDGKTMAQKMADIFASPDAKREGIIFDGIAPTATIKINPAADGSGDAHIQTAGTDDDLKVVLTFNEPVYPDNGKITLQRKGTWGIPAVLTSEEFMRWYNKTPAAQKSALIEFDSSTGVEKVFEKTGIPSGPYQKITHGLKQSKSVAVPNTDTQYVLAFEHGPFDTSDTVNNIRAALSAAGYDKHVVDIQDCNFSNDNKTVTITFTDTDANGNAKKIDPGIEWELIFDEEAIMDNTGNYYDGTTPYTVWTNTASTPVIRLDRYSHGYGAVEPLSDGKGKQTGIQTVAEYTDSGAEPGNAVSDSGTKLRPTGYVRFRIDSQTPGATVYFKIESPSDLVTNAKTAYYDQTSKATDRSSVGDIAYDTLASWTGSEAQEYVVSNGNWYVIGDGELYTSRKDYVMAYAAKTVEGTALTNSSNGMEGAFKTVAFVYSAGSAGTSQVSGEVTYQQNMEGGTAKGGEPNVSGFPLRDGGDATKFSKNMYYAGNETDRNLKGDWYVWQTYEIVTDWAALIRGKSNTKDYPVGSYGQTTFAYNEEFY